MLANPLIQRYRFSVLRPRQLWIYCVVYLSLVLMLLMLNSAAGFSSRTMYFQFLVFQVIILFVWSSYNTGSAVSDEVANKSYDFFRLLPLSAHQKAWGIVIGKNLLAGLFALINFIILTMLAYQGHVRFSLQYQVILFLVCATLLLNLVSLLFSLNTQRKRSKHHTIVFIIVAVVTMPYLITAVAALYDQRWSEETTISFYRFEIPVMLWLSALAVYFAVWAYLGILRRFIREKESLFRRDAALLFVLGAEAILLGLYLPYLNMPSYRMGPFEYTLYFWAIGLVPVLWTTVGSAQSFEKYFEVSQFLTTDPSTTAPSAFRFLRRSNLTLSLLLFAIWAVFAVGYAQQAGWEPRFILQLGLILLTAFLFLILLLELWVLYRVDSEKVGILLGFIALVFFILPLILAAIFEKPTYLVFSPLGLFAFLFEEHTLPSSLAYAIPLVNVLLCLAPAFFVHKQYRNILEVRKKM